MRCHHAVLNGMRQHHLANLAQEADLFSGLMMTESHGAMTSHCIRRSAIRNTIFDSGFVPVRPENT